MGLVVVRHRVEDFAAWKQQYDEHAPVRETAGLTGSRVYQSVDDPNNVVILLEMADVAKAKAFAASDDLKAAMERAGVTGSPSVDFLEGPIR
jgi:heme-degrading monooxygenase HmoA